MSKSKEFEKYNNVYVYIQICTFTFSCFLSFLQFIINHNVPKSNSSFWVLVAKYDECLRNFNLKIELKLNHNECKSLMNIK